MQKEIIDMISQSDLSFLSALAQGESMPLRQAEKFFDKVISEIIRDRDSRCVFHPANKPRPSLLAHAHIIPRAHHATRWHIRNGISLCYGCHCWFDREQHTRRRDYADTMFISDQKLKLIAAGWTHVELQKLALASMQTWDKNIIAVALQLQSYL